MADHGILESKVKELEDKLKLSGDRVHELERFLLEARNKNRDLQFQLDAIQQKEEDSHAASSSTAQVQKVEDQTMEMAPLSEADATLRRLVQRIAMILQAEKIVIMFHDRERDDLTGISPAYGVEDARLGSLKVKINAGISGQVYREGTPQIFHDALHDPRALGDIFHAVQAANGVTVPLIIEKRDEENRVIDRNTIGVLHALNKRHGEDFVDEDVRLLERMARNVGSIIANLQLYREVIEQNEELHQTFESLTAGLILISPSGKVSQMNASARAIFGLSADVQGKLLKEVLNHDSINELIVNSTVDGSKQEFQVTIAGVDRTYEAQSAAVRSEEGKDLGVVIIINDITELRNIDKMKSAFVAMASHELRTPLTAIKGFVSTLLVDTDESFTRDDRTEFYNIIDHECDRLKRLIDDLLNTARIEANESLKPDYAEVEMQALLDRTVRIQRQATQRHKIELDTPIPIPNVNGDSDKLDQILTNLLNNAIKYSPNGGTITVHAKVEGDFVIVGVQDQGLGIPKDQLGKVFERFHRVNNDDNRKIYGTGLGLFLVKHLVEKVHLGHIWVESELGVGSTFWFKIPVKLDIEEAKRLND